MQCPVREVLQDRKLTRVLELRRRAKSKLQTPPKRFAAWVTQLSDLVDVALERRTQHEEPDDD